MNATSDYVRFSHRRTIWTELQRVLLDRFVSTEEPAHEQMICEDVPSANKEVSQEALLQVLDELEQLRQAEQQQMSLFEFRRRDVRISSAAEKSGEEKQARLVHKPSRYGKKFSRSGHARSPEDSPSGGTVDQRRENARP